MTAINACSSFGCGEKIVVFNGWYRTFGADGSTNMQPMINAASPAKSATLATFRSKKMDVLFMVLRTLLKLLPQVDLVQSSLRAHVYGKSS